MRVRDECEVSRMFERKTSLFWREGGDAHGELTRKFIWCENTQESMCSHIYCHIYCSRVLLMF